MSKRITGVQYEDDKIVGVTVDGLNDGGKDSAYFKRLEYAHWDDYYGKCSNCGKIPFMDGDNEPFAFGYEYCPYCGAMMEYGD